MRLVWLAVVVIALAVILTAPRRDDCLNRITPEDCAAWGLPYTDACIQTAVERCRGADDR